MIKTIKKSKLTDFNKLLLSDSANFASVVNKVWVVVPNLVQRTSLGTHFIPILNNETIAVTLSSQSSCPLLKVVCKVVI